jgi:hypothetical protein
MEKYLDNYDSYERKIVYDFGLGDGGIGDNIKYFMNIFNTCIKFNIKLYYLLQNHPCEKFLKLKYKKFYITQEEILNNTIDITDINDVPNITSDKYYKINPRIIYKNQLKEQIIKDSLDKIFYFSDEVILNSNKLLFNNNNIKYISIHLRLGDSYLETEKKYVSCKNDKRSYIEENIFKYIENNSDKNIIFFCDNKSYKLKLKNLYKNIIITDCDIGHTSFTNTTDKQVLDAITEFYLMSNSTCIIMASLSGFPIMASKFKNIPLQRIYI